MPLYLSRCHGFLENVVDEPRTDTFKVSSVFDNVVDGIERFRLDVRPDYTSILRVRKAKGRGLILGLQPNEAELERVIPCNMLA